MTYLIVLGGPGAGKGTQAMILSERLGIPHVATGDLFRAAVREGSELGREAHKYMDRGQLVPDGITIRMLLDRLAQPDAQTGAVLDGFPRTAAQADALDKALAELGAKIDYVLEIDVPPDDLVRRMTGRWICEANGHPYHETAHPPKVAGVCDIDGSRLIQREDDREETIRARLQQQIGVLHEVASHYRARGVLRTVDGRGTIDQVAAALLAQVEPAA